ncbi:MAG: cobalamin-dependent protein [Candidatus Moduliflexus flocculans]|nr:cobalamin-dependent protein [Candidatus Moduliflexus flocculans]
MVGADDRRAAAWRRTARRQAGGRARGSYDLAVERHGLRPADLLLRPADLHPRARATRTTRARAALETLEAHPADQGRTARRARPSSASRNVSFGLTPRGAPRAELGVPRTRRVEAGLDAAHRRTPRKIAAAARASPPTDREIACATCSTTARAATARDAARRASSRIFEAAARREPERQASRGAAWPRSGSARARGRRRRRRAGGRRSTMLLRRRTAARHHQRHPAGRRCGRSASCSAAASMQLPFVLQSAEVMKAARRLPRAAHGARRRRRRQGHRCVLATVKGDVHDIGKNLVDIILTNNGYRVVNLGIKHAATEIIVRRPRAARGADAIGISRAAGQVGAGHAGRPRRVPAPRAAPARCCWAARP